MHGFLGLSDFFGISQANGSGANKGGGPDTQVETQSGQDEMAQDVDC